MGLSDSLFCYCAHVLRYFVRKFAYQYKGIFARFMTMWKHRPAVRAEPMKSWFVLKTKQARRA